MNRSTSQHASYATDRRTVLQIGAVGTGLAALPLRRARAQTPITSDEIPISGEAVPVLSAFDTIMSEAIAKWNLPGARLR